MIGGGGGGGSEVLVQNGLLQKGMFFFRSVNRILSEIDFLLLKLFVSKCPNYGRGSEPSLSIQTVCVHTSLYFGAL